MPLTVERIVEETRTWSDDQLVVLVGHLTQREKIGLLRNRFHRRTQVD